MQEQDQEKKSKLVYQSAGMAEFFLIIIEILFDDFFGVA